MKIEIKDRKECNISVARKRLKIVSQRRGADETKKLFIPPYLIKLYEWKPPHKHAKSTPELAVGGARKTGKDATEHLTS
ncbi:hypothetical protein E2C01_096262 [Portunus trituberculatus]|uniref:Uncharacterized protein n=1 Tax=Portunus trituberculatus TaxID=210409 RepID=A0A5B7K7S1_PORTR|nr:hypothetical protein [Portunus trituberculatus]